MKTRLTDAMLSTQATLMARAMHRQKGLTIVEYAVAGGLITVVVITAFQALGGSVAGVINAIDAAI